MGAKNHLIHWSAKTDTVITEIILHMHTYKLLICVIYAQVQKGYEFH